MNRYVIFDLDGTLFDSMGFWDGVGREFLMRNGISDFPPDFNIKVMSMSIAQSSNYFRDVFNLDVSVEDITEGMREIIADKYRFEATFKENVRETLDTLLAHGVKMCIATATYKELVEEALERIDGDKYFDFILSCNDIGYGKDNPKIFLEAMNRLGGDRSNTVIVEDALHAITTAKKEHFKVVAVYDRYQEASKDAIMSLCDKYLKVMDADTILNV